MTAGRGSLHFAASVARIALVIVGKLFSADDGWQLQDLIPWGELGGILIGGGLLGIWLDSLFQREQQDAQEEQLKKLLTDHAPVMRNAVLQAFAADHEDLGRVATPETLDRMISNSLALRLGDQQFASEISTDITVQAINAPERWLDAEADITISPHPKHAGFFEVTARWEYTVVPAHVERRFICLSDRAEYTELAESDADASVWYMRPNGIFEAQTKDAYELLAFTVDGKERPIRRSSRKGYQAYTVHVGQEAIDAGAPITISYTTRTVTKASGHLLFFDIEQPAKDITVNLDYTACSIASISAIDLVPSVRPTRIEHSPEGIPSKTLRVEIDGWTFPRSGVAFVWTLESEADQAEVKAASRSRR